MPKIIESNQDALDVLEMLKTACKLDQVQLIPAFTVSGRKVRSIAVRDVNDGVATLLPVAVLIESTDDLKFSKRQKRAHAGLSLVQGGQLVDAPDAAEDGGADNEGEDVPEALGAPEVQGDDGGGGGEPVTGP